MHQIRDDIRLVFQVRWPQSEQVLEALTQRAVGSFDTHFSGNFLVKLFGLLSGRRAGPRLRWSTSALFEAASYVAGR
jgi:hypothetical protein